jgi:hypothetical protein
MTPPRRRARLELLRRLLEAHERSRSFGRPAPWPRDVLLRIDAREFPSAFGAEGREELAALRAAVEELERAGAVRLVRHHGPAEGEPHEVRVGPAEVETAYRLAAAEGFEPLGVGLAALAEQARALRAGAPPDWMARFLEEVEARAADADLAPLGMQRERFKKEWRDLLPALTAAVALARGAAGWERVVSERIFGDSKKLGALRGRVADLLARADPRWDGIEPDEATDLLEAYGVRRKPGLLRCAGSMALVVAGRAYRLEDFTPTAHLPDAWAGAWVEAACAAPVAMVTTVENEYPFLSYVEEAGGPAALGERRELAIYTAGFPSPALVDSLAAVARRRPETLFRHWGDADLGGLRIWWLLRGRLGRPVDLFRTRPEWLEHAAASGGAPLSSAERAALARLRAQLLASPSAAAPDVSEAVRLLDSLLRLGVKMEQERY